SLLVIPPDAPDPTRFVYEVMAFNPPPGGGLSYAQPYTVTNPVLPPGYTVTVIENPGTPLSAPHPARVAILRKGSATATTLAAAAYDNEGQVDIIDVTNKMVLGSIFVSANLLGDIDTNPATSTVVVPATLEDGVYVI